MQLEVKQGLSKKKSNLAFLLQPRISSKMKCSLFNIGLLTLQLKLYFLFRLGVAVP